ncbi:MAG: Re/Si-specific NAD(P)(+) transhydrogenase subunit alpha [Acidobacteriota bacterium]
MIIGVLKETLHGERRVALVAESVQRLVRSGLTVQVQAKAGMEAGQSDGEYEKAGARIVPETSQILSAADLIVKVRLPTESETDGLREAAILIALLDPEANGRLLKRLADRHLTALALERIPRIARAQNMDVLSSMSTIAGYKAAVMGADRLPRFFPLLMTAAGTIPPARVLVIGAGVAGLQAIGTARRLGARVEAFDPRPAAREQVESLGARFVGAELLNAKVETAGGYAREQTAEERDRQKEALLASVARADLIICSALVAGRKAPVVLDEAMVRSMPAGSVVVDLAAAQGGNCSLTEPGEEIVRHGVTICGPENVPSLMPSDASRMFSRNVMNLLTHMIHDGQVIDLAGDEITRACLVAHRGQAWSDGEPLSAAPAGQSA